MQSKKIVVLGTGGTIAGVAIDPSSNIDYSAACLEISQLVGGIAGLSDVVTEQVTQIDSKDMSFEVWTKLANRVQHHLSQSDVQGMVITHGTDTLEETAYFLQVALNPAKPVVLTCAMRPASAPAPDGPQNLFDAVTVARHAAGRGVVLVCAGDIHSALDVQKVHTYRVNAFSSGDSGLLGIINKNIVKIIKKWPFNQQISAQTATKNIAILNTVYSWPKVEIIMNYAGADGTLVDALLTLGVRGLVVAGTGNGSVHQLLEAALMKAAAQGIQITRSTRCTDGRVFPRMDDRFPTSNGLSPVKARIDMMLRMMGLVL